MKKPNYTVLLILALIAVGLGVVLLSLNVSTPIKKNQAQLVFNFQNNPRAFGGEIMPDTKVLDVIFAAANVGNLPINYAFTEEKLSIDGFLVDSIKMNGESHTLEQAKNIPISPGDVLVVQFK